MIKKIDHKAGSTIGTAYSIISMTIIACVIAFIIAVIFYYGWDVISRGRRHKQGLRSFLSGRGNNYGHNDTTLCH